ncbi:MAG: cupin, partial [Gammaproteobacteria bacterium]
HQIINTGDTDLRYFCLSTNEPQDICEYPDSDKLLAYDRSDADKVLRHMARTAESIDYFDGEK